MAVLVLDVTREGLYMTTTEGKPWGSDYSRAVETTMMEQETRLAPVQDVALNKVIGQQAATGPLVSVHSGAKRGDRDLRNGRDRTLVSDGTGFKTRLLQKDPCTGRLVAHRHPAYGY